MERHEVHELHRCVQLQLAIPWKSPPMGKLLTQRALREALGTSPRETDCGCRAADRGERLLGEDPRSKGTDRTSNGRHFGSKWIRMGGGMGREEKESEWERREEDALLFFSAGAAQTQR